MWEHCGVSADTESCCLCHLLWQVGAEEASGAEKINPGSGREEREGVLVFVVTAGVLRREGVKKGDKYRQTEAVSGGQPECKRITWR